MNLQTSLQYPLAKFLVEELNGSFFKNELRSLYRMLMLYHNRSLFSLDDQIDDYLEQCVTYLKAPMDYWYLNPTKKSRIKTVQSRMCFAIENNPGIFRDLLARKDYSWPEAKQYTIKAIYRWLQTNPQTKEVVDIDQWRKELLINFGSVLKLEDQKPEKSVGKPEPLFFHQLLMGKDENDRIAKFNRLIKALQDAQWIMAGSSADQYLFRNRSRGGRLQLAALYYTLLRSAHIVKKLQAPQVAACFNSWLKHDFSDSSFVKCFQTEQQQVFDCGRSNSRYKYVLQCQKLIEGL